MIDPKKLDEVMRLVQTAKTLGISPIGIVCATEEQYVLLNTRVEFSISNNVACVLVAQSGGWAGYHLIITFDGWEDNYDKKYPSKYLQKRLDSLEEVDL